MPTDLAQRIAEMKAAAEQLKAVKNACDITHADPRFVSFITIVNPAAVLALIAELERLRLGTEVALRNAQLLDRIRLWSKCPDGYPLDEHINNIAVQLGRQEREIERLQAVERAWHERFD